MKTLFLLAAALAVAPLCGDTVIRPGGAVVVVGKSATPTARFAAGEMAHFLSQTLGAKVKVANAPVPGKVGIFVGESEWTRKAGIDPSGLARDGFVSSAKDGRVYLLGTDDPCMNPGDCYTGKADLLKFERATLNAVYDFLERYADVRFFFPGELGTVVARKDSITVPDGERRVEPVYTERYFGWYNAAKDGWHDKSVTMQKVTAQHWLRLRYGTNRRRCCHGLGAMKYVKRFGKEHPEWFALRADGTRNLTDSREFPWRSAKFCYTSQIREAIYQDAKAFLTGAPASSRGLERWGANCISNRYEKYVDIMPEDGFEKCLCPNCQAAYRKDMSAYANDLIWKMTVDIAQRLKDEGVEGGISQMAYWPYDQAPGFKIPDNVQVMVSVNGPWSTGTPSAHEGQMKKLRAWTGLLGHKVWVWTYPGKYNGKMKGIPEISPRAFAKFFSDATPYIFGGYIDNDNDRFMCQVLNLYVFAKMAWDPAVDVEGILDDWNGRLFGAAKAEMKAAYDFLEEKWVKGVCFRRTVEGALGPVTVQPSAGQLWTEIYTPKALSTLRNLFDRAAAKVGPDSLEARRIALMRAEFLEPLERQSREADVGVELARRRAERPQNLIANGDFDSAKGWVQTVDWGNAVLDRDCKVTGSASARIESDSVPHCERSGQGEFSTKLHLKKTSRYRLSYFIKTKDVVSFKSGGAGLYVILANGRSIKNPKPYMNGTCDWVHLSLEFTPPVDSPKALIQFRLENALGTMWVDGVLLEELAKE